MNRRMGMGGDTSLNAPLRDTDGEGQWQDFLVDNGPLQDEIIADDEERRVRHELLIEAMDSLNDREKHILTERRLIDEPKTLEDLSQVYGVSRERIRQIEVRAFEKLQGPGGGEADITTCQLWLPIEELSRHAEKLWLAIAQDRTVIAARHNPQLRVGNATIHFEGNFHREEPVAITVDNQGSGADCT